MRERKFREDGLVVVLRPGEDAEGAIKKFSRKVRASGLLREVMEKSYYQKPSAKRRQRQLKNQNLNTQG